MGEEDRVSGSGPGEGSAWHGSYNGSFPNRTTTTSQCERFERELFDVWAIPERLPGRKPVTLMKLP